MAPLIATQFEFVPRCIVLPADRPVTLRFASPDVIHGILVTGTNVNTMVIPGYVAQVHTRFTKTGDLLMPCHEYCGLGHSQMLATVKVVPARQFRPDADGRASCGLCRRAGLTSPGHRPCLGGHRRLRRRLPARRLADVGAQPAAGAARAPGRTISAR